MFYLEFSGTICGTDHVCTDHGFFLTKQADFLTALTKFGMCCWRKLTGARSLQDVSVCALCPCVTPLAATPGWGCCCSVRSGLEDMGQLFQGVSIKKNTAFIGTWYKNLQEPQRLSIYKLLQFNGSFGAAHSALLM